MSTFLREDEITLDCLETLLVKEVDIITDYEITYDEALGGVLFIRVYELMIVVQLDPGEKAILFFSGRKPPSDTSFEKLLSVVNLLNLRAPMLKFSVASENGYILWRYAMLYEGGITAENFVSTFKRFCADVLLAFEKDD